MNALTKILMEAAGRINKENDIKLKKVAEFGDEFRGAGVYRDREWNEYYVLFVGDGAHLKESDYHTSHKQDALDTASSCAQRDAAVDHTHNIMPGDDAPTATEEPVQVIARPRPRGYYSAPSDLLSALLARAAN